MKKSISFLFILSILAIIGIWATAEKAKIDNFGIKAKGVEGDSLVLECAMIAQNPNFFDVYVSDVKASVYVDGNFVKNVSLQKEWKLVSKSETQILFDTKVSLQDMANQKEALGTFLKFLGNGSLKVVSKGTAQAGNFGIKKEIPFECQTEISF